MDTAVSSVVIVLNNNVRSLQDVHVHTLVNVANSLEIYRVTTKTINVCFTINLKLMYSKSNIFVETKTETVNYTTVLYNLTYRLEKI